MTLLLPLLLVLSSQAPSQTQELPPIQNFLQVTPQFCTGGQPRLEHFAKLKSDGVKAVLNLRQPSEHRAEEEQATVEQVGLKYFNIPVVYRNPTDIQVGRVSEDHGRSGEPSDVHPLHGGHSCRRLLGDSRVPCAMDSASTRRSRKAAR